MTCTDSLPSWLTARKVTDMVLGAAVMGTVGTLIGLIMGGGALPVAATVGVVLGVVVGIFGGRRFFVSILVGAVGGGALAWVLAGLEAVSLGAGAGAAMGGFLGVQITMLLDMRAQRKHQAASVDPPG
ncbi:MAG: hypothetical protein O7C73_00555 [Nitrospirae bacterium]|nr:hypothetical protein [Nitrospirota bacterium]